MKRQDIVDAARRRIGTRFHHGGRGPGGVDCYGFILLVFQDLGRPLPDRREYRTHRYGAVPAKGQMLEIAREHLGEPVEDAKPGDLLVMFMRDKRKRPSHLAIKTDTGIVHVHERVGKVREDVDSEWVTKRTLAAFQFKGVED